MNTTLSKEKRLNLRGLLMMAGESQAAIARKFSCTRQYVYQALYGKYNSDKAESIRRYAAKKANLSENYWHQ